MLARSVSGISFERLLRRALDHEGGRAGSRGLDGRLATFGFAAGFATASRLALTALRRDRRGARAGVAGSGASSEEIGASLTARARVGRVVLRLALLLVARVAGQRQGQRSARPCRRRASRPSGRCVATVFDGVAVDRARDVPGEPGVLEHPLREDERLAAHVGDDQHLGLGRSACVAVVCGAGVAAVCCAAYVSPANTSTARTATKMTRGSRARMVSLSAENAAGLTPLQGEADRRGLLRSGLRGQRRRRPGWSGPPAQRP